MKTAFTLIEILITVAIFSIIIAAASGFFVSAIRVQRRVLATQELLDQTSYALEYMGRALRMAKKELGDNCLSSWGLNYEIPGYWRLGGDEDLGKGIRFINALEGNDCQEFFLADGQLKYWKKSSGETFPLTSDKLKITSLKFKLKGKSQGDDLQPRVTIFLEVLGRGREGEQPKIQIQTTVSQRNLDVPY